MGLTIRRRCFVSLTLDFRHAVTRLSWVIYVRMGAYWGASSEVTSCLSTFEKDAMRQPGRVPSEKLMAFYLPRKVVRLGENLFCQMWASSRELYTPHGLPWKWLPCSCHFVFSLEPQNVRHMSLTSGIEARKGLVAFLHRERLPTSFKSSSRQSVPVCAP